MIDGVCRDLPTVHKLNYNIFTKGHYMVTGKDRVEARPDQRPGSGIRRPGSARRPGGGRRHRRCGDPQEKAARVLEVAKEIAAKEAVIEKAWPAAYRCGRPAPRCITTTCRPVRET